MVSERDPTRYGFTAGVAVLLFIFGVLFAIGRSDDPLLLVIGLVLAGTSTALFALSFRRYRREKARTD